MLPGDVNNRKSAKLLDLLQSWLAGRVVFASIYMKYSVEVKGGFPRPYSSNFFRCNLLKTTKRPMPAELTNYARCKSWVHHKQRNEILKKKSKDKILISSPVSIFFDKFFLVSSPNRILAIELSKLAGTLQCAKIRPELGCLIDISDSTCRLAPCLIGIKLFLQ